MSNINKDNSAGASTENQHGNNSNPDRPSPHELYKFMVKNQMFETTERIVTGRQICEIAGLIPPEKYKLDVKLKGGKYEEVGLDKSVDLSKSGVEKFVYITRDQTEG